MHKGEPHITARRIHSKRLLHINNKFVIYCSDKSSICFYFPPQMSFYEQKFRMECFKRSAMKQAKSSTKKNARPHESERDNINWEVEIHRQQPWTTQLWPSLEALSEWPVCGTTSAVAGCNEPRTRFSISGSG